MAVSLNMTSAGISFADQMSRIPVLQVFGTYLAMRSGPLSILACIRSQSIVKRGLGSIILSGTWGVDYSGRMFIWNECDHGLTWITRSNSLPVDSAYCIDRNLGSALGRPPGIPDDWVDADVSSSCTLIL